MTQNQLAIIESQIRDLRRHAFDGTPEEQDQTTRRIHCLKALCMPEWAKREVPENSYARVMWL